jgi:hypothetical protein
VLSRLQERRKQTNGIQDLKRAWLDRGGARLPVTSRLPLDQPHVYSVAGQFTGSEQSRRLAPTTKTSSCVMSFEFY